MDEGDTAPGGTGGWGPAPERMRTIRNTQNKFVGEKVSFLEIK